MSQALFSFDSGLIDNAALERFIDWIEASTADENVRVLAIDVTSNGDNWTDMGEWPARLAHRRPAGTHGPGPLLEHEAVRALRACMKPTVALLRGDTLGLAMDFACTCDVRVAAAGARIGDPRITQGRAAATGITYLLPRLIGQSQAMRLLLLGEIVDAEEALRIDLVHEVYDDFERESAALVERIAGLPTRAWEVHKLQVLPQMDLAFDAAMTHSLGVRQTHVIEDRLEGMRAWRERRPPEFTGR